jgi:hypothetical protein
VEILSTIVSVTARYPSADAMNEELVKLLGLSDKTKDEDICKAFLQMLLEIDNG